MPFSFEAQAIPGVFLITPKLFGDQRGFFMETFRASDWMQAGLMPKFMQENHSRSRRETVRGLHYQVPPYGQAKLVRAITGAILDVAVDMRLDSATFGRSVQVILSEENRSMLYIPEWCAHGFAVVSDSADVVYKTSREYAPDHEGGVIWNDPELGIHWPKMDRPTISDRDKQWPSLNQAAAQFYRQSNAGEQVNA
jgi:dTDP-4-dehydrorhamnose 3,5-epimerase